MPLMKSIFQRTFKSAMIFGVLTFAASCARSNPASRTDGLCAVTMPGTWKLLHGECKAGKAHGYGEAVCDEGLVSMDDSENDFILKATCSYRGTFKNGRFDGVGKLRTLEALFFGNFKDGELDGIGLRQGPVTKYLGVWSKGLREGDGFTTFSDGTRYFGNYINDKHRGLGLTIFKDGEAVYCKSNDGKREGMGILVTKDGEMTCVDCTDIDSSKVRSPLRCQDLP
jgi:hypothetical protein